jgi:hypothetical protein
MELPKALWVALVAWAWVAACVALLWLLVKAPFYAGSWWQVLAAFIVARSLYRISVRYQLEKSGLLHVGALSMTAKTADKGP